MLSELPAVVRDFLPSREMADPLSLPGVIAGERRRTAPAAGAALVPIRRGLYLVQIAA
jgi:hypothetical protein